MTLRQKAYSLFWKDIGICAILWVCMTPLLAAEHESKYPPKALEFGVFPHLSVKHVEETFGVIAKRFAHALKKRVNFNAQLSFDFFKEDLRNGIYDVVFLQPFDYVAARKANGYTVIATQQVPLRAFLVARPSRNIRTAKDIHGHHITLPPQKTAISYLVRAWLRENGFLIGKDVFLNYESSHISCMQRALIGFADICGTAPSVLEFVKDKLGFDFQTIVATREIPHTLFAVHPRVSQNDRRHILEVLLQLHQDKEGKEILDAARMSAFRIAKDSEYDVVRSMVESDDGK